MTEDEMAKEYIKVNNLEWQLECNRTSPIGEVKQAYLAGLKAGKDMAEADLATIAYMQGAERDKTKWHKVANGDYPPYERDDYSINVLIDCRNIAYYNYDEECWVAEPSSAEIDPPVAWCEIPKYEEGGK